MTDDRLVAVRCPVCGSRADVLLQWHNSDVAPYAEVIEYRCPHRCQVDTGTVHNLIGQA